MAAYVIAVAVVLGIVILTFAAARWIDKRG